MVLPPIQIETPNAEIPPGFSLPMFIKHAGSILNILATYVLPVIVAGLAVAYDAWTTKKDAVTRFRWDMMGSLSQQRRGITWTQLP